MGNNFQFYPESGFISYTPSATNTNSSYPLTNLYDYWRPRIHWRSQNTLQNTLSLAFGSSKSIIGIQLIDCNFTTATINGVSSTLSQSKKTRRYNRTHLLTYTGTGPSIVIHSQQPTDNATYFRIGSIICMSTVKEVVENPDYPLVESAEPPKPKINTFTTGNREKIKRGGRKIYKASFGYNLVQRSVAEDDLWDLDAAFDEVDLFVFYPNDSDTSRGVLCQKDTSLQITRDKTDVIKTSTFELVEVE